MPRLVKKLCIYCQHFPCGDKEADATVTTELVQSYPFLSDNDKLKPCKGKDFEINADLKKAKKESDKSADEDEDVAEKKVEPEPIVVEKVLKIIKNNDVGLLQETVEKLLGHEDVVGFQVQGLTTVYNTESAQTQIIMALEISYRVK